MNIELKTLLFTYMCCANIYKIINEVIRLTLTGRNILIIQINVGYISYRRK